MSQGHALYLEVRHWPSCWPSDGPSSLIVRFAFACLGIRHHLPRILPQPFQAFDEELGVIIRCTFVKGLQHHVHTSTVFRLRRISRSGPTAIIRSTSLFRFPLAKTNSALACASITVIGIEMRLWICYWSCLRRAQLEARKLPWTILYRAYAP
jgi:hypothetical protein